MTTQQAYDRINKAKANGFQQAFIGDVNWNILNDIRMRYQVFQGWNNKHLTGVDVMEFGYIIKLK